MEEAYLAPNGTHVVFLIFAVRICGQRVMGDKCAGSTPAGYLNKTIVELISPIKAAKALALKCPGGQDL